MIDKIKQVDKETLWWSTQSQGIGWTEPYVAFSFYLFMWMFTFTKTALIAETSLEWMLLFKRSVEYCAPWWEGVIPAPVSGWGPGSLPLQPVWQHNSSSWGGRPGDSGTTVWTGGLASMWGTAWNRQNCKHQAWIDKFTSAQKKEKIFDVFISDTWFLKSVQYILHFYKEY